MTKCYQEACLFLTLRFGIACPVEWPRKPCPHRHPNNLLSANSLILDAHPNQSGLKSNVVQWVLEKKQVVSLGITNLATHLYMIPWMTIWLATVLWPQMPDWDQFHGAFDYGSVSFSILPKENLLWGSLLTSGEKRESKITFKSRCDMLWLHICDILWQSQFLNMTLLPPWLLFIPFWCHAWAIQDWSKEARHRVLYEEDAISASRAPDNPNRSCYPTTPGAMLEVRWIKWHHDTSLLFQHLQEHEFI